MRRSILTTLGIFISLHMFSPDLAYPPPTPGTSFQKAETSTFSLFALSLATAFESSRTSFVPEDLFSQVAKRAKGQQHMPPSLLPPCTFSHHRTEEEGKDRWGDFSPLRAH